MVFYVGQKVVCVDAGESKFSCTPTPTFLTEGAVYEIESIAPAPNGFPGFAVQLVGIRDETKRWGFASYRFRPVVERKTSIEVFTAMLNPAQQKERV